MFSIILQYARSRHVYTVIQIPIHLIVHASAKCRVSHKRSLFAETLVSAHLDVSSRGAADAGSAVSRAAAYAVHCPKQHEGGIRTDCVSHA